jgi:hypothetical protein
MPAAYPKSSIHGAIPGVAYGMLLILNGAAIAAEHRGMRNGRS